jgi:hypothetical protein
MDNVSWLWNDVLSLYSRFYEVFTLIDTYAIGERKKRENIYLDIKLCL